MGWFGPDGIEYHRFLPERFEYFTEWVDALREALAGGDAAARSLAARCGRELLVYTWVFRPELRDGIDLELWRDGWTAMFREKGYTLNGLPAKPPDGNFVLFRGCGPDGRDGLSWTPVAAVAKRYAELAVERGEQGFVYAHHMQPDALLAYVDLKGDPECVVDPRHLGGVELVDEL